MPTKKSPEGKHDSRTYRPDAARLLANRSRSNGGLVGGGSGGPVASGSGGPVASGSGGPVASGSGGPVAGVGGNGLALGRLKRFENGASRGMGWLRDYPDHRDSDLKAPSASLTNASTRYWELQGKKPSKQDDVRAGDPIASYNAAVKHIKASIAKKRPSWVDNSAYCSPIEDQGQLGSCTAFATVGMVEYMERRAYGSHIDASHLFLYKVTRNLMGSIGDTGAYLREAMKAMVLFGAPPAESYPYRIEDFDLEPARFIYSYAGNFKSIQYLRLDGNGESTNKVKENVLSALAIGYVTTFGFSVFPSMDSNPDIPVPGDSEAPVGGHALLAVGYDDDRPNWRFNIAKQEWEEVSKGALLIRNSWGTGWGDNGYGWLPYEYIDWGLADDFWTCLKQEWVNLNVFS